MSKQVKGFPFDTRLSKESIIHMEALRAFDELREQVKDVPEMSLEEINEEIRAVRAERKGI